MQRSRKNRVSSAEPFPAGKPEILALLVHELSRPLTGIGAAAELLRRDGAADAAVVQELAASIAEEAADMRRDLEHLIAYCSGGSEPPPPVQPIDVAAVCGLSAPRHGSFRLMQRRRARRRLRRRELGRLMLGRRGRVASRRALRLDLRLLQRLFDYGHGSPQQVAQHGQQVLLQ